MLNFEINKKTVITYLISSLQKMKLDLPDVKYYTQLFDVRGTSSSM